MTARMYALPAPARMLRAPSVAAFVAGAAAPVGTPAPAGPQAPGSGATTRTLTGATASTRWGPVQVAVVLTGGTITQVQVAGATYTSEGYRRSLQSALDQR